MMFVVAQIGKSFCIFVHTVKFWLYYQWFFIEKPTK